MKKRERTKKKDNIIFLPGLEQRLMEKGLECLQMKQFEEAISLLEEAREHDPENSDILIGLVIAYFEAAAYNKAKELANEMLLKGLGDYLQLIDLYLTILIQLHEYKEIASTIEALLDENLIPADKHEHFLTILQFSKRMVDSNQWEIRETNEAENDVKKLELNSYQNLNEQMLLLSSLAERNIRPYIEEIKDYLSAESGHPFLKTMLVTLLKEQEYSKEITIRKFLKEMTVLPTELPEVNSQPKMKEIEKELRERLENRDPVLFENIISMVERTFFISYPFELEPKTAITWAAAFHFLALEYLGTDPVLFKLANEYDIQSEKVEQAIAAIREIEEISYPNL